MSNPRIRGIDHRIDVSELSQRAIAELAQRQPARKRST